MNHLYPAVAENVRECYLQKDHLLFSCAGCNTKYQRLCPCRDYQKGQVALCRDCLWLHWGKCVVTYHMHWVTFFFHKLFCNSQEGSGIQDNSKKELIFGDLQKHLDANDVGLSAIQGWITLLMFLYNNSSTTPKIIRHPWRNLEDQAEIFQKAKHLFSISSSWNIIFYEENKFKLKQESHEIVCVCVRVFLLLFLKSVMSSKCLDISLENLCRSAD